ncbi:MULTISPECIES: efflux RND transporter permease subunit [unclassified Roseateles]|uniref:efflux RND transporter permease subunit n=1 Tax=unclassified Roseateles TaxID=2626991 RepID=UPI0006FA930C|nr:MULTISPECIES: efflux RND transporter permease subunit [unclassified Roseateles]KQW44943.1 RND transporter [Pelomonas sp. Root405]KRA70303.1 RND transporter [Pelomonas sp. Root662]
MFNVSRWSIANPVPAIMLFIMLTAAGLYGFKQMKIQQFPDIELPTIVVSASLPGAAPAQMETEVARKIENSLAAVQGLKHLYTKVQDGVATITAEYRLEKPLQEALDDTRDAVSRIRADLPADLRDPVITKMNLSGMPILTYTVSSTRMDDEALSWFVDNQVAKRMLAVRGVGSLARVGGVSRELRVEIDPARLLALRVSAADVSRQLKQVQQEAPGGRAQLGGTEQSLRTIATVQSADQLAALSIPLPDGRQVRLDQVASVSDTLAERRSGAFLNGKQVVGFEIVRAKGAGEVDVAERIRAALEELKAAHPDITITEAFNFVDPVIENYEGSLTLLLEGAFLAVVVVWFFLRDWRATFVSAVALPLSAIPTFLVMYWMGFTLNVVTLLSLSLVIGVLVDDAIVEIENIMRHLTMGKTPLEAAREAADEIGLAVIATTFTLIAVFLPTAFMSGVVGKFFVQFGWTASIAVFFSLVVARMLTPMMAAYILKAPKKVHKEPFWMPTYLKAARWAFTHKGKTMALTAVFGVAACTPLFMGAIPGAFIPPDDLSQTQISVELPPGSTYEQTAAIAEQVRVAAAAHSHVKLVYTAVGGGSAGGDPFAMSGAAEARKATLTLNLTPRSDRSGISKQQIERELRERLDGIAGARLKVSFGGSSEKYQLVLAGEDGEQLAAHAAKVEKELRALPGIGQVTSSSSLQRPELIVRPDAARAADLGVSTAAIADTLRIATAGDYDQLLPKLNLSQRQIPIVVRLPDAARTDLALLGQLTVPGTHGPVPLQQVAEMTVTSGPAQIDRYDRLRNVNFEIELNGRPLSEVQAAAAALPSITNLPPGVSKAEIGDAEAFAELGQGFLLAMGTGVACIYIVLVLLFHAWVQPVTILGALVLSIPGAILALFVTQTDLSMPAMIGMIMLMGIATKNSILLVEYAIVAQREQGLSRLDALLDACHKRARPIVMTTLAMGAGMLPIALGFGTDPSFRAPMAIVVIGGLITSTFLSLLVIPVLYEIVDDMIERAGRLRRRGRPSEVSSA